ncbi:putative S-adenosyl-L-methionine-dependent methyltransferase [Lupinus albus]|uniref:Methyltransferase n=1 Tax=Lupinus albus TaxID=3870 RepID=A0A6A4R567_LUPAL|nr:putative S-adenosyl-L-methionine-dependent methyltransferase [Lupinus albus]
MATLFPKKPNKNISKLYLITLISILCTFSYLIGLWHNSPTAAISGQYYTATDGGVDCPHLNSTPISNLPTKPTTNLDFSAHHHLSDPLPNTARVFNAPPCNVSLSEYTPCEDVQRSLKFPRENLIYRERHCPEADEVLKCRIPAPYGYRIPFRWPESRDSVWYANVPHKELTIEKKNQNWVRYEGERLKFPGGGTMFPRGASAYIDDIGALINLKDGSIRTALDTGCGVCIFFFIISVLNCISG